MVFQNNCEDNSQNKIIQTSIKPLISEKLLIKRSIISIKHLQSKKDAKKQRIASKIQSENKIKKLYI